MRQKGASARRKFQIAGFSDKAISVGATLPISYVKRFNSRFTSPAAGKRYHSIILKVKDQRLFPEIVEEVKRRGLDLAEKTNNAVQAAQIILSIEAIFTLISLVIVGIASLNISQMFFMMITQRRREIGLLRAVGASPGDIQMIILGEATMIGCIGGVLGMFAGYVASFSVDLLAAQLPRFPYKPESFFVFPWWVWGLGVIVSVIFCILGAYLPARSAATQEPAEALTQ
jgi:ABC-type lipoprotein release transport system permease subunit